MTVPQPPTQAASLAFRFWTPPPGFWVPAGADEHRVPLPEIPLPVQREVFAKGAPGREEIGQGLYDYLRQFPDCRHNRVYAELLRDAFPHFLADLGAQAVMLDHKEVDPPYVKRKINALKILALLDPGNGPLQQQIGLAWFQLALTFSEMGDSRRHFQQAMIHLGRALDIRPDDPAGLNALAQIDYFLGDFPAAARRWRRALESVDEAGMREALEKNLARVVDAEFPETPLIEEFEAVGNALELCGAGRFAQARKLLDRLEEQGRLATELPSAEFFYLLGHCREKTGDPGGAFAAYDRALELAPGFQPAREGRERVLPGGADDDA
jgi:tetratricopeptide (TPR) repeat protein